MSQLSMTAQCQAALRLARGVCQRLWHGWAEPPHLLLALLETGGNANTLLAHFGWHLPSLQAGATQHCQATSDEVFSFGCWDGQALHAVTLRAFAAARARGADFVATEDLLVSLAAEVEEPCLFPLGELGISPRSLVDHFWILPELTYTSGPDGTRQASEFSGNSILPIATDWEPPSWAALRRKGD